jgi:hypothetical protein
MWKIEVNRGKHAECRGKTGTKYLEFEKLLIGRLKTILRGVLRLVGWQSRSFHFARTGPPATVYGRMDSRTLSGSIRRMRIEFRQFLGDG